MLNVYCCIKWLRRKCACWIKKRLTLRANLSNIYLIKKKKMLVKGKPSTVETLYRTCLFWRNSRVCGKKKHPCWFGFLVCPVSYLRLCVDIGSIIHQLSDHISLTSEGGDVQSRVSFLWTQSHNLNVLYSLHQIADSLPVLSFLINLLSFPHLTLDFIKSYELLLCWGYYRYMFHYISYKRNKFNYSKVYIFERNTWHDCGDASEITFCML